MELYGIFLSHKTYARYNCMSCFKQENAKLEHCILHISSSVILTAKNNQHFASPLVIAGNTRPCQGNTHSFSFRSCMDDDLPRKHILHEIQITNALSSPERNGIFQGRLRKKEDFRAFMREQERKSLAGNSNFRCLN